MESKKLSERIESRIKYWMLEMQDLPDEYSKANYARMKWIQETITGLQDIKTKFLKKPQRPSPEQKMFAEMLY